MAFQREFSDYKRYLTNSIRDTQYMCKSKAKKFVNSVDGLQYTITDAETNADPRKIVIDGINRNVNGIIDALEEYEFDKYFKYFALYELNLGDYTELIQNLLVSGSIINSGYDYISNGFEKPTYIETEEGFDLKFSTIISNHDNYSDGHKNVSVISYLANEQMLVLKVSGLHNDSFGDNTIKYDRVIARMVSWVGRFLSINYREFNGMKHFKDIRSQIRLKDGSIMDVFEHKVCIDDEFNGSTTQKATDSDKMILVDGILDIIEEYASEEVQFKVQEHIENYEENATFRMVSLKWKSIFSKSRGREGNIVVTARKVYDKDTRSNLLTYKYTKYHVMSDPSVDRERINYVVKYLSEYSKQNIEKSEDRGVQVS